MFVIVENNRVILGPMPWRPKTFQNCLLEDCGVTFDVPKTNNNNEVITVTNDIKIYPVVDKGLTTEYNPVIQFPNGPYYNYFEDRAEMYYAPEDKSIDRVKSELKYEVAANRFRYEIMGVKMTLQNTEITVLTDRQDRNTYLQAYQLGTTNVNWKFGDTFLTLTNEELGQIVFTGVTHIQATFDWESAKVAAIDACTQLSELAVIDIYSDNPDWEPPNEGPFRERRFLE